MNCLPTRLLANHFFVYRGFAHRYSQSGVAGAGLVNGSHRANTRMEKDYFVKFHVRIFAACLLSCAAFAQQALTNDPW